MPGWLGGCDDVPEAAYPGQRRMVKYDFTNAKMAALIACFTAFSVRLLSCHRDWVRRQYQPRSARVVALLATSHCVASRRSPEKKISVPPRILHRDQSLVNLA